MSASGPNSAASAGRRPTARAKRVDAPRCAATTTTGAPCPIAAMHTSRWCFAHDPSPEVAERRELARRAGGMMATGTRAPAEAPFPVLDDPEGFREYLATVMHQVHTGELSPKSATAIAQLAGVSIRLAEVAISRKVFALEKALLERRR